MKYVGDAVPRNALVAVVSTALLFLIACDRTPGHLKRPDMTPLSPRLQPVFEKTSTVCFGRFVIDIPATATIAYGPAEIEFPIEYYSGEVNKIEQRVAEDLLKVEQERRYFTSDEIAKFPMFGKVIDGSIPGQKIVFGSTNQVSYSVSSFIPIGKDLFVQRTNGVLPEEDEIISVRETLTKIASHLVPRSAGEIPKDAGSCFDGGFIALPLEYEKVTLGVRLMEFPDVHFSVEVHKNQDHLVESSGLELLLDRAEKQATKEGFGSVYASIKTMRRGPRKLGVWNGFEIVARKPAYKDDTDAHEFRFHSMGAVNDPLHPELDIRFYTGVRNDQQAAVRPSLTDEEAVAVWDKLLGTIRVRQPRDSRSSSANTGALPLGQLLHTGEHCVQTGWWQCTHSTKVDTGSPRHFVVGELMPHIVLLLEPTLWQKLNGERTTTKKATVWKLVRHEKDTTMEPEGPANDGTTSPGTDHA